MEAYILETMKKSKKGVFRIEDIMRLTGLTQSQVYNTIKQMKSKGLIHTIKRGIYILDENSTEDFLTLTQAYAPSYIGLWSALSYWGLYDQVPTVVHLVTTHQRRETSQVRLHIIEPNLFRGYVDEGFPISSVEKTIFDMLWFNQSTEIVREIVNKEKVDSKKVRAFLKHVPSLRKKKIMKHKLKRVGL